MLEQSKYESGVVFELFQIPMGDGSCCWEVAITTSTSSVRFSMVDEKSALRFFDYITHSSEIVEVSTDDEIPRPSK